MATITASAHRMAMPMVARLVHGSREVRRLMAQRHTVAKMEAGRRKGSADGKTDIDLYQNLEIMERWSRVLLYIQRELDGPELQLRSSIQIMLWSKMWFGRLGWRS